MDLLTSNFVMSIDFHEDEMKEHIFELEIY